MICHVHNIHAEAHMEVKYCKEVVGNHYFSSLSDTSACVYVSYGRDTRGLFCCSQYSLLGSGVGSCTVPAPNSDAEYQDVPAFYHSIECCQQSWIHFSQSL